MTFMPPDPTLNARRSARARAAARRVVRDALSAAALGLALGLAGCLFEPKIEDQWTRLDIMSPAPDAPALPDTSQSVPFHGQVTFRAIRTGSLIAEVRVSDTISYGDVDFGPEAPRREVLRDVERLLAESRSLGISAVLTTGWDRLIREVDFKIATPGGLAHGPDGGVFVLFYLGEEIREEAPDGTETSHFEPFDFEAQEVLPMGCELRTVQPASASPARRGGLSAAGAALRPTVAVGAATTLPARHLGDYQWDVTPQATWSASVGVDAGDWRGQVELRQWGTTQTVAAASPPEVAVRLASVQPQVERRLVHLAGADLAARAGFGALRLGYSPEALALSGAAGGSAEFKPLWTWLASAGLSLRQPLSPALALGIDLERSLFPLETTHRNGGAFENQRESFGGWSLGGRLTWRGGAF